MAKALQLTHLDRHTAGSCECRVECRGINFRRPDLGRFFPTFMNPPRRFRLRGSSSVSREAKVSSLAKWTNHTPPWPEEKQVAPVRAASGDWRGRQSMASLVKTGFTPYCSSARLCCRTENRKDTEIEEKNFLTDCRQFPRSGHLNLAICQAASPFGVRAKSENSNSTRLWSQQEAAHSERWISVSKLPAQRFAARPQRSSRERPFLHRHAIREECKPL